MSAYQVKTEIGDSIRNLIWGGCMLCWVIESGLAHAQLCSSTSDVATIAPNVCRTIHRRDVETGVSIAFSVKR